MKVRTAFVSNSSTSSFIAYVDKDWYDQYMEDMKKSDEAKYDRLVKIGHLETEIIYGNIVCCLSWYDYHGYCSINCLCADEHSADEWEQLDRDFNELIENVPDNLKLSRSGD